MTVRVFQVADLHGFDHPSVTHPGDLLDAKALHQLVDLGFEGLGVLGVAGKYLHRNRPSLFIGQQATDNRFLAFLAIAVITLLAQLILIPFELTAGDIVQIQRWRLARRGIAVGK